MVFLIYRFEFQLGFKTTTSEGVLFYVHGDRHTDFIAVYLLAGQITFAFNCGDAITKMVSPKTYNDGQWHTVSAVYTLTSFLN